MVSYAWDVTSRVEYALKEPLPGRVEDWSKEAAIMKNISHVSIQHHREDCLCVLIQIFDSGSHRSFEVHKF